VTEYKDMLRLAVNRKRPDGGTGVWKVASQFEPAFIQDAAEIGKMIVAIDPDALWRVETVGGRPVDVPPASSKVIAAKVDGDPRAFVPLEEYEALQRLFDRYRKAVVACVEATQEK
jgi:hypothetical protein